uniref:MFS domain-containing protein n=1 Tax=Caenorhabditis japonica TaxID=281687 RepID=A0A8R1HKS2_CAEJA
MLYVPEAPGLKPMGTIWKEVIVSITPGMAAVGAWFSGAGSDKYGRRIIIIGSTLIFVTGAVVCAVAWTKIVMLIGRIFLGVGIGFASMVVPVYLGEASPTHIRGTLVSAFAMMISFGQVVANVMGGLFSYWSPYTVGWRLMFAFAGIPALIQFVCFIFLPETPRWLYENGQEEKAKEVLKKIYSGDEEWINFELAEIETYVAERKKQMEEEKKSGPVIWRVLKTPHVLKACFIGSMLQAFQQLAGINTVLYYTADIIRSAGIENYHTIIWISVILSVCNLIGPFVPMTLIEKLGRRKLFLFSCAGVIISLVLIGVSFLLVGNDSAPNYGITQYALAGNFTNHTMKANDCFSLSNCDQCVTSEQCGFCENSETKTGFCYPVNPSDPTLYSNIGICSSDFRNENASFPNGE